MARQTAAVGATPDDSGFTEVYKVTKVAPRAGSRMGRERRAWFWRCARVAVSVALPMGVLSAVGSYALRESFDAEEAIRAAGIRARGGPSVLVLLGWGVGGWLAGGIVNRHLGLVSLPGMGLVVATAAIAVLVDLALYAVLAEDLPELMCMIKVTCGVVWIVPGVWRVYLD